MAKKAKNTPKDTKTAAVNAALKLAARKGWNNVSLRDVAAEAKITLAALHDHFEDRADILAAYGRMIDRAVIERTKDIDGSPRDILFDVLMERFDVLNKKREAVVAILQSFRTDPKNAILSLPHLGRSMSWMLEAAQIDTGGTAGALRIAGLTAVYLKTLYTWAGDESEDLSPTMAALDKNLGYAERIASTIGLEGNPK